MPSPYAVPPSSLDLCRAMQARLDNSIPGLKATYCVNPRESWERRNITAVGAIDSITGLNFAHTMYARDDRGTSFAIGFEFAASAIVTWANKMRGYA